MFKIKARLTAPRINWPKYLGELQRQLMDQLTFASVEWVQAATDIIPIWSGASVATFIHLAYAASYQMPMPSPVAGAPNRVAMGLAHGGGHFDANAAAGHFSFTYWTNLDHLIFNEYNNANEYGYKLHDPGPYDFQNKSNAAATQVLVSPTLPDVFDCITTNVLKV